jgi:hypothetical protein
VEPEQLARYPAERLRLRAPGREEAPPVLNSLPPTLMLDVVGAPTVEDIQNMM